MEWIHQAKVEAPAKKPTRIPEELIPSCYHSYLDIFSEKATSQFPLRKPWDHAIDLKDLFKPKKGRLIPLSLEEQTEVSEFIDEQLAKGYIHPSKSEQMLPVFFMPKKDERKWMVQDYRYLNEHSVEQLSAPAHLTARRQAQGITVLHEDRPLMGIQQRTD